VVSQLGGRADGEHEKPGGLGRAVGEEEMVADGVEDAVLDEDTGALVDDLVWPEAGVEGRVGFKVGHGPGLHIRLFQLELDRALLKESSLRLWVSWYSVLSSREPLASSASEVEDSALDWISAMSDLSPAM
jgi:hypothetical protein